MWHRVPMSFWGKLQYRRYLCFICGLGLLLPLIASGPILAGSGFPKVPLKQNMVVDTPEAILAFRAQAVAHRKAGAFAKETGSTQAKAWFLSHISPAFVCERDFGGGCTGDTYIDRINSFLFKSGQGSLYGEGAMPADPDSLLSRGLHTVSIDLSALTGPLEQSEGRPDEYCRAGLQPRSWETLQKAVHSVVTDPATDITDELMATDRLKGVLGAWNVRAGPDVTAEVVGRAHNEVVLFLSQEGRDGAGNSGDHIWHAVQLHSGVKGYLAATDANLVHQIDPRVCLGVSADGDAVITRYIGGGD